MRRQRESGELRPSMVSVLVFLLFALGIAGGVSHFLCGGGSQPKTDPTKDSPARVSAARKNSAASPHRQKMGAGASDRRQNLPGDGSRLDTREKHQVEMPAREGGPPAAPFPREGGATHSKPPISLSSAPSIDSPPPPAPPPVETWQPEEVYLDENAIAGRVLSESGDPIAGITVLAEPLARSDSGALISTSGLDALRTVSDAEGFYAFRELVEGSYRISVDPEAGYEPVSKVVPSGSHSADIVVRKPWGLEVHGKVEASSGGTLQGVSVSQSGRPVQSTTTDANGKYSLAMAISSSMQNAAVVFWLQGYKQERILVSRDQWEGRGDMQIDVKLQPIDTLVTVSGQVRSAGGEVVAGARVDLLSSLIGRSFNAETDERGTFVIREVPVGDDYQLLVRSDGRFKDYRENGIKVTADGLEVDVVLDFVGFGSVSGEVVDAAGTPLPSLRLTVRSSNAPKLFKPLKLDGSGYFIVDEIPAGELFFEGSGYPDLRAWGLDLQPGSEENVRLVFDWGENLISGQVLDTMNEPVVGAQVLLSMEHQEGRLKSRSNRKTTSDENGFFSFTGLGPGLHQLRVDASGHEPVWQNVILREPTEQVTIHVQ